MNLPTETVTDYEIVSTMQRFGGHFARALAEAATRADEVNLAKLRGAFPDLWAEYRAVVLLRRGRP